MNLFYGINTLLMTYLLKIQGSLFKVPFSKSSIVIIVSSKGAKKENIKPTVGIWDSMCAI